MLRNWRTPIRIVLADDRAILRTGIRQFLAEEGDIQVVAEASNGAQVKTLIWEYIPDVAILDSRIPGTTCVEVTRWIREQRLPVGILILTAYEDDPFVIAAIQAGADGYILKNAEAEQITAAVLAVYDCTSTVHSVLTRNLMAQSSRPSKTGDDHTSLNIGP